MQVADLAKRGIVTKKWFWKKLPIVKPTAKIDKLVHKLYQLTEA